MHVFIVFEEAEFDEDNELVGVYDSYEKAKAIVDYNPSYRYSSQHEVQ